MILILVCYCAAGIDFKVPTVNGTHLLDVVIPANTTKVPIKIEILNDNVLERSETFRLNVMIPQSTAELGLTTGSIPSTKVTINNDDSKYYGIGKTCFIIIVVILYRPLFNCHSM